VAKTVGPFVESSQIRAGPPESPPRVVPGPGFKTMTWLSSASETSIVVQSRPGAGTPVASHPEIVQFKSVPPCPAFHVVSPGAGAGAVPIRIGAASGNTDVAPNPRVTIATS